MARKGNRIIVALKCEVCNSKNYTVTKNRVNTTEKLELKKFCKTCGKTRKHKEAKVD